jgi:hypothetical protein
MVDGIVRGRDSLRVWFCMGEWLEHLVFRNGTPVSSAVRRADPTDPLFVAGAEEELPPEVRGIPAVCVVERLGAWRIPGGMQTVPLEELAREARRTAGLFRGRKHGFFRAGAGAALLGAAAVVLAVCVFAKGVDRVERRAVDLGVAFARLEDESRRVLSIGKVVEDLEKAIARLDAMRPRDLYASLSELLEVLGEETQVVALTLRDEAFEVDAVGTNSLRLMERFQAHEGFGEVKLSHVIPDAQSGRERFSFAGSFRVR